LTLITAHAYKHAFCTLEAHVQLHIYSNEHSPTAQRCNIITRHVLGKAKMAFSQWTCPKHG